MTPEERRRSFVERWVDIVTTDVTHELDLLGIRSFVMVSGDEDKRHRTLRLAATMVYGDAAVLAHVLRLGREALEREQAATSEALDDLARHSQELGLDR